jgi:metal-responsive CopG/Arc/MetJ family transcriptional regulator
MAKEDCVDVQVRNVPKKLLDDFDRIVVKPKFPGGRAEAIRELMRRAIQEQKINGGS